MNFRIAPFHFVVALVAVTAGPAWAQHAEHYVLDGFGGVHAGGGAPAVSPATAYFGWDVAVDIAFVPHDGSPGSGDGILVLDRWGGVHLGGTLVSDPPVGATPYFGFDAARAIVRRDSTIVYSAAIGSDGTLSHSRGVQFAAKLETGKYSVTFDRAIRACSAVATLGERPNFKWGTGFDGHAGDTYTYHPTSDNILIVVTRSSSGALTDFPFQVIVHC